MKKKNFEISETKNERLSQLRRTLCGVHHSRQDAKCMPRQ